MDPVVQATALYALEQIDSQKGHEHAQTLLSSTQRENWLVHETATSIIGEAKRQKTAPTLILKIMTEGRSEQRIFQQPIIRMGRSQLNEVVIDHPRISQQHAVFTLDEQGLNVIVLDRHGVLHIDKQVIENERYRLKQGDVIRFCDTPEPAVKVQWELRPVRPKTSTTSLGTLEKLLLIFENSFLKSVKPDALIELAKRSEIQIYAQGEVLYNAGEFAKELHLVLEGEADVIVNQGGNDVVINTLRRGQTIGEMGILSRKPCSATVVVTGERNRFLVIDAEVFESVLRADVEISRSLLMEMIGRLQETNIRVQA